MNFQKLKNRNFIISIIALASAVILLVGNALFAYFTPRRGAYIDMTKEGLYTLSSTMKKETEFLNTLPEDKGVEIIFCTDSDYLINTETTRLPYFMSLQLQKLYPSLKVKTVNCEMNPTALAPYKTTSLTEITPSDIIVSFGDRYRIVDAEDLWGKNSTGGYFSYDGEFVMTTLLRSVTAVEMPKAYFLTDHGESYYDTENPTSEMSLKNASLADMLMNCGLEIHTLKISEVEKIPDDCVLLIINNPREDFKTDPSKYNQLSYISDTEKIDRYLVKNQGALIVAKDFKITLPVFEEFLYDWGFEFGTSLLKDETSSVSGSEDKTIIAEYNSDENSYAYSIYGEYADISSAPISVFKNTGYIKCSFNETFSKAENGAMNTSRLYTSFLSTSDGAKAYSKNAETGEYVDLVGYASKYDVASLVVRDYVDPVEAVHTMSFILCANSEDFLSNEILGNAAYANYDITAAVAKNISRTDYYASPELGGNSYNSSSLGGKQIRYSLLSYLDESIYSGDAKDVVEFNYAISDTFINTMAVCVFLIPAAIAVLGIVICLKRRFL